MRKLKPQFAKQVSPTKSNVVPCFKGLKEQRALGELDGEHFRKESKGIQVLQEWEGRKKQQLKQEVSGKERKAKALEGNKSEAIGCIKSYGR